MVQASILASLNSWARAIAKSVAARTGGVRLYHYLRDRETLTVIMLHRVLPKAMFAEQEPDPEYTVSTELLERLVPFLCANYTIVGLPDVLEARRRGRSLPSRPLLITFDDGWDDTLRHAAPVLATWGVPWTLFVAAEAIGTGSQWWQETLLNALRTSRVPYRDLWRIVMGETGTKSEPNGNLELALLNAYGALDSERRDALLTRVCKQRAGPDMADWNGLRGLLAANVSIGVHGFSHLPLTMHGDPEQDLRQAQELLHSHLGAGATASMSFPHGRYDAKVLTIARKLGFELMFTSDAVLNACPGGWLPYDTIGRISVVASSVCNDLGEFDPGLAERWLMLRKRQKAT